MLSCDLISDGGEVGGGVKLKVSSLRNLFKSSNVKISDCAEYQILNKTKQQRLRCGFENIYFG